MAENILTDAIHEQLVQVIDPQLEVLEIKQLSGGSINTALWVRTNLGNYFAKFNDAAHYNGVFEAEAKGLQTLRETRAIRIPNAIATFQADDKKVLLLEYIESGTPHYDFWRDFGTQLATMHKHSHAQFGFEQANFIGSLPQENTWETSWIDFFVKHRLEPQLKLAVDGGKADTELVKKMETLYQRLPDIFPEEKPALIHGDLWSGNMMADLDGDPVIYDPAVYYGHREMDLAMSKLFGGFETEFYEAYQEAYPLERNWEQRVAICNLYPLLVHVNLFVGSYIQSVKNILNRF